MTIKNILENTCAKKGLRLTKQRETVLRIVQASKSHPDAETVFKAAKLKLPDISLDTVYRALQTLEELGLIFRVDNQIPRARFDADLSNHSHFICMECSEVFDIFNDTHKADYSMYGDVQRVNIQVKGICNNCKNSKGENYDT